MLRFLGRQHSLSGSGLRRTFAGEVVSTVRPRQEGVRIKHRVNGNSVKLEAQGITVTAAAKVTVNAGTAEVNVGMLTVNAGMSQFSGVVQCATLITNSVVSSMYTPGIGNVW